MLSYLGQRTSTEAPVLKVFQFETQFQTKAKQVNRRRTVKEGFHNSQHTLNLEKNKSRLFFYYFSLNNCQDRNQR